MTRTKSVKRAGMTRTAVGRGTAIAGMVLGLSCILPPAASAAPRQGIRALAGTWRVVGVRVADSPVQALSPNDPSYMGAVLVVTPTRLSWRGPLVRMRGSSLNATCEGPKVTNDSIVCRSGSFAPPGGKTILTGGRLSIDWYDGGTLLLKRLR